MAWKRYYLEVGTGVDMHGEDYTKAAKKAVKDAISGGSMIGLRSVCGLKSREEVNEKVMVDVTVAVAEPEKVDGKAVLDELPEGMRRIKVVKGGMRFPTPENTEFADIHGIVIAAAIIVILVKD